MKKNGQSPLGLYTIGIAALFLVAFFLLVVLGARSYRGSVDVQDQNMETRALLAYLNTAFKANDCEDAFSIEDGMPGADGKVLIMSDPAIGYDVRIYQTGGNLVEDYASSGSELMPEEANFIAPTTVFAPRWLEGGRMLEIETDAGCVRVAPRSGGGTE